MPPRSCSACASAQARAPIFACSARRPRRSAAFAANTARSCFIKGTNRKQMREALQAAIAARPDLARRTIVDVDPVSVL